MLFGLTEKKILKALESVKDPQSGGNIVACGMISGLQVQKKGQVLFVIETDPQRGALLEPLRRQAEKAVATLPGVTKVTAVLTAQKEPGPQPSSRAASPPGDPHGMGKNPPLTLPIRKIIAVASGKGGVGKSMVAANLAAMLAKNGRKTGLLDADIYGPSVPKMTGLEGQKPAQKSGRIIPLEAHGVKVMSIGFMLERDAPLIWRGPMAQSALYQMLRDVEWGTEEDPLDALVIDLPPGTGDVQLTLAQKARLAGAIIVSTPQDIALIDARKAVSMFQKVGVPILGLIENMSTHICSNCGHEDPVFGHGGARAEAERLGVPFLGEIPLSASIRMAADAGELFGFSPELEQKIMSCFSAPA